MDGFGELIALVAVVGGLTIPVVAIVMDFRRRKLRHAERLAMIERGMTPPATESVDEEASTTDPVARREKLLQDGIVCLFVGAGLALGAVALLYVPHSFIPRKIAGPALFAAAIVACTGIGMLVSHAVTRPKASQAA